MAESIFSKINFRTEGKPVIEKGERLRHERKMCGRCQQSSPVTMAFWLIKIAATTLGETAGDAVSMTLKLGYAASTVLFFAFFLLALIAQIKVREFHRFLYWAVIVATTTVGTTMADFMDRSLGIGYVGGSLLLCALLGLVLLTWRWTAGGVSFSEITSPKIEGFYWLTILFSNTLGTALGDFLSDDSGLDYGGGALVFAGVLVVLALLYFFTKISRTFLFWGTFVLTRPLGATVGDLLTKPHENGGLDLSRIHSSAALVLFMVGCIFLTSRRAGQHPART